MRVLGGRSVPVAVGTSLVTALIVLTALIAGCDTLDSGLGMSVNADGTGHARPVPGAPTGATGGGIGVDPCALLGAEDRSSAGLTSPGEHITVAGSPACDYVQPGSFGLTVTVDGRTDLEEVRDRAPRAEAVRVGSAHALLVADRDADDGVCSVSVSVGSRNGTVHIDVTNADFHDTTLACTRATTVAELIEPELT